ncbi:hypothetical protein KIS4809_5746 [Bacillus sp. ZZV12-4809]|nr:hypothetical protein KIS4809_5746 [Bacillus sp. ZZV12-4809]
MSNVLFASRLQDSLILPRGYFLVQTPFSFITGMLPRLLNKEFSKKGASILLGSTHPKVERYFS